MLGLCLTVTGAKADEQRKISLDRDHSKETISLPYCNIFVSTADMEDEDGKVKIELENLDETNPLLLFDHAYEEKAIKKMPTSIRFDKTFGGTKNKRRIDPFSAKSDREDNAGERARMNRVMLFNPSDKLDLPLITVANGEKTVCRLPVYIAKYKGKKRNKVLLLEKQVIELDLEVEFKPSAEYLDVKDKYDKLVNDLTKKGICTNPKHSPSASKQRDNYTRQIDELKEKIDAIISKHGWVPSDKGFERYDALKKQLSEIDLSEKEGDCGRHKTRAKTAVGHSCGYCSLSMQQIYHQLDDLYKRIYNSSDRKAAKAGVMKQVNALYNCAKQRKGSDYKSKINERYSRISKI